MARMVKDGEEFKMSKRTGKAVALKDLVEEAGVDAVRYFFVSRAADTHMDFDIDMAKKQTNENPVYYAQYAHARMCSILRSGADIPLADHYELITHEKNWICLSISMNLLLRSPMPPKPASRTRCAIISPVWRSCSTRSMRTAKSWTGRIWN